MVLSLMLIGYYTMNNEPGTGTDSTKSTSVSVPVEPATAGNDNTTSSSSSESTGTSASKPSSGTDTTTSENSTDWYVSTQTQLQQQIEQKMDALNKVITNNNSTPQQLSDAQKQLTQLTNLDGGLDNAHDMIVGKGYKDCVIVPNSNYTKFTVYVKTDKLTADQAVDLIQVVSQQLNVPAINVSITPKA